MTTEHLEGCSSGLFQMSGQIHNMRPCLIENCWHFLIQDPKHWFVKDRISYGNKTTKRYPFETPHKIPSMRILQSYFQNTQGATIAASPWGVAAPRWKGMIQKPTNLRHLLFWNRQAVPINTYGPYCLVRLNMEARWMTCWQPSFSGITANHEVAMCIGYHFLFRWLIYWQPLLTKVGSFFLCSKMSILWVHCRSVTHHWQSLMFEVIVGQYHEGHLPKWFDIANMQYMVIHIFIILNQSNIH